MISKWFCCRHPASTHHCPTHSLELLEPDIWQLQNNRRLSSVSTTHMRSGGGPGGHPVMGLSTMERSRRRSSHLRSTSSQLNTIVTLPVKDRGEMVGVSVSRSSLGPISSSSAARYHHPHQQQQHHSHDNPYYQPRSSEISEYNPTPR